MIKTLFERTIPPWLHGNLPLLAVTACVWLVLLVLDLGLRVEALPWGIISLEIPRSSEHALQAINSWTAGQQRAAMTSVRLDYVFIVCYVLVLCRWGLWLKKSGRTLSQGKLAVWISGTVNLMLTLAVIAGACDVLENLGLSSMIESANEETVLEAAGKGYLVHTALFHAYLITKACAIIKFVCLGVLICLGASSTLWYVLASGRAGQMLERAKSFRPQ